MTDLTTGLPELPEGHWWEVRPDKKLKQMIDTLQIFDHGYSVNIVTNRISTTTWDRKHWWSFGYSTIKVPPYTEEVDVESTYILKSDVFSAFDSTDLSATITPEAVLKAAKRCKETWDRRVTSYGLIGKYPPKKLVTQKVDNV